MPEPIIEPTTIARLIHLPSIRDAGSGHVSIAAASSLIELTVAGPLRTCNGARLAQRSGHREVVLHDRDRGCCVSRGRAVTAADLRAEKRDVLLVIVDHVTSNLAV